MTPTSKSAKKKLATDAALYGMKLYDKYKYEFAKHEKNPEKLYELEKKMLKEWNSKFKKNMKYVEEEGGHFYLVCECPYLEKCYKEEEVRLMNQPW